MAQVRTSDKKSPFVAHAQSIDQSCGIHLSEILTYGIFLLSYKIQNADRL